MKRFAYMTSCAVAAVALLASTAQAKPGIHLNGPALDGQRVALPDGLANRPALDGRRVALPGQSRIAGTPAGDELFGGKYNGPALDGRRVEVPGTIGHAIDRVRLPDGRGLAPWSDARSAASQHEQEAQR